MLRLPLEAIGGYDLGPILAVVLASLVGGGSGARPRGLADLAICGSGALAASGGAPGL